MCIIAIKKAGFPIWDEATLKRMFKRNPDGAGLMYRTKSGTVHIEKGFMEVESLLEYIKTRRQKLNKTDVILHCRISTSGKTDALGTHPYPVLARNDKISCNVTIGMAHNGMLDAYGWKGTETINDTQIFIRNCLKKLPANFLNNPAICDLIGKSIGSNKLAFLDNKGIHLFGEFLNPKKGYYYSNGSYEEPKPFFIKPKVKEASKNRDTIDDLFVDDCFPDYDPTVEGWGDNWEDDTKPLW